MVRGWGRRTATVGALVGAVALLGACSFPGGGQRAALATPTASPTATATPTVPPSPTATATPSPTVPPSPTATLAPTPTRVPSPAGTPATPDAASPAAAGSPAPPYTVRDAVGLCQVTLPGNFRDDGGIWRVDDEAGVTLVGTLTGGFIDFNTATNLLLSNFQSQVADFHETGRTREAPDRLRITYTADVFGAPGSGILYQRQFGQTICGVALFATNGKDQQYAPIFEGIIASLTAVH